jgi:hypothetical protein
MPTTKGYTPQLSREVVSRLYHKAKVERIPMTVLANRIMEKALGANTAITASTAAAINQQRQPK